MDAASIVDSALRIVAAVAPGLLALITGQDSDEDALKHAAEELAKLERSDDPNGRWAEDLERVKRGD